MQRFDMYWKAEGYKNNDKKMKIWQFRMMKVCCHDFKLENNTNDGLPWSSKKIKMKKIKNIFLFRCYCKSMPINRCRKTQIINSLSFNYVLLKTKLFVFWVSICLIKEKFCLSNVEAYKRCHNARWPLFI